MLLYQILLIDTLIREILNIYVFLYTYIPIYVYVYIYALKQAVRLYVKI